MKKLGELLKRFVDVMSQDSGYLILLVALVAAMFVVAVVCERIIDRKNPEKISKTKRIALIGLFAAVSGVLMRLEIQVPYIPPFYKLDFSEVPVMISGFMLGPVAGVITEFVKIFVKLALKPTETAFVGEFANFTVGCAYIIPATVIYKLKKTKKMANIGMIVGTVVLILFGSFANAFVFLPAFARLFGNMPIEDIIAMGTGVNPLIKNMQTFVALGVVPINLLKGVADTVIVALIYKKISKLIKTRL